jgi:hypothetical protein
LLAISPAISYAIARKALIHNLNCSLEYAPMNFGKLNFSLGNTSADYAGDKGPAGIGDTYMSLIYAENLASFYQKRYFSVENGIEPINGLMFRVGAYYEKRNDLTNNTSYSFFGGKPASNTPHGQQNAMPNHSVYKSRLELGYTPRRYYTIRNGRKYKRDSAFPTIALGYTLALNPDVKHITDEDRTPTFDMLELSVYQDIKLSLFDRFNYFLNAGKYLSGQPKYLPDYKHFATVESFFTSHSLNNTFARMDNYRYATNNKWMQAHLTWTSDYLLIKRLPFLQRYLFDEALHVRTLWTPQIIHSEAGYSVGFGNFGRAGLFVTYEKNSEKGDKNLKFNGIGISLSSPISSLFKLF